MRAVLSRTASVAALVAAAAVPAAAPAAEPGERTHRRGDDVRELEDVLTEIGLRTTADGVFGTSSVPSVRRYERAEERSAVEAAPLRSEPPDGSRPAADTPERAFPVDGEHTYGDGFGDRPNHQGSDVLSACGTPLRAVSAGTVRKVATEGSAGRFIVLHDAGSGQEYVYMHMSEVAVSSGERVRAGERVGAVGQTGNATTCHLHFEVWSAPGWYAGGSPHDPMPLLRSLSSS